MESKNNIISKKILIKADIEKVYTIWTDIEKWSLWTKSINKISFLENNSFNLGGKARVEQPKLSPAVWIISEIKANELFTWYTKLLGVKIIAKHILQNTPNGTIAASILIYEGLFASIIYKLSSKITSEYLTLEINGLKTICEKT